METRRLGRTGLEVPALCMGTMTFGLQTDATEACAILDRAADAGMSFIDTADVYPLGGSLETVGRTEEIIREWMRERGNRSGVLLATKCRGAMGPGPNDQGLSRQHIIEAVDASLRRLGTDYIDLYQTHYFDPKTPIEETLRALDDLVRSGRVRYVGCSNYPGWQLSEGLATSERLGIARYESVQPRYNLLYRELETELLPLCRAQGPGVLVSNPPAARFRTGQYRKGQEPRAAPPFPRCGAAATSRAARSPTAGYTGTTSTTLATLTTAAEPSTATPAAKPVAKAAASTGTTFTLLLLDGLDHRAHDRKGLFVHLQIITQTFGPLTAHLCLALLHPLTKRLHILFRHITPARPTSGRTAAATVGAKLELAEPASGWAEIADLPQLFGPGEG